MPQYGDRGGTLPHQSQNAGSAVAAYTFSKMYHPERPVQIESTPAIVLSAIAVIVHRRHDRLFVDLL